MRGDNFRTVSPDVQAWALAQHFGAAALPIEAAGPRLASWSDIKAPELKHDVRMPNARRILEEVCAKHGVSPADFRIRWRQRSVVRAKYEFWARCRAEIVICGAPASWPWIARLTNNDTATVMRGAKIHARAERRA